MTGWGVTRYLGRSSRFLRHVTLPVVSHRNCKASTEQVSRSADPPSPANCEKPCKATLPLPSPAGVDRQHVLCWLPGDGARRLQWRQRRALRSPLPQHLVPGGRGQLGGAVWCRGEVRCLHPVRELPRLDKGDHGGPTTNRLPDRSVTDHCVFGVIDRCTSSQRVSFFCLLFSVSTFY